MELAEIFSNLTHGELKQTGLGGYDQRAIQPDAYEEILHHVNLGLLALYTRFPLAEQEVIIHTEMGKTLYTLPVDDVLRINAIYSGMGVEVPLNDEHDPRSIFTVNPKTIQIPFATDHEEFCIVYRAKPAKILTPDDPTQLDLTQEVELPDVLLEPLLAYVEYRYRKAVGSEASVAMAAAAKSTFDMLCFDIERLNILNNANTLSNIRPQLNGWV